MKKLGILFIILTFSCSGQKETYVYNGRLEADTIILSARTAGIIDSLFTSEGSQVNKNQKLAKIDSKRLVILKEQQQARLNEIDLNRNVLDSKIRKLHSQLDLAGETLTKTENLFENGAVTEQKLNELQVKTDGLKAGLDGLFIQRKIIASKKQQLQAAMQITILNIEDTRILSPINGLILNSFHRAGETARPGLPLFEVGDLTSLKATIYVSLKELSGLKIGQNAQISVDGIEKQFTGKICWISSVAEFTPKTILTKETRTTLVYAVKISVANVEGILKIGTPVDINLL